MISKKKKKKEKNLGKINAEHAGIHMDTINTTICMKPFRAIWAQIG